MKLKPIHVYLGAFIIALLLLIFFYPQDKSVSEIDTKSNEMPNDDVHKGLNGVDGNTPNAGNVSEGFKKKLNDLAEAVKANPNDTVKVKEYAELLSAAHKPDEAIKLYESIFAKDPNRIDILMPLVYLEYTRQNLDKADEYTNKVLKIDPNHAQAHYNLGAIYAAKGYQDKAKEIWEMVIKRFPKSEAAHIAEQSLKQL